MNYVQEIICVNEQKKNVWMDNVSQKVPIELRYIAKDRWLIEMPTLFRKNLKTN